MHAAQWGGRRVPVCRRKEIKAPLWLWEECLTRSWKGLHSILNDIWATNLVLTSPQDPQNSALWGWTKGLIWTLAGKQKNPQSQTKNLPTLTVGNLLRNCWYGNYCSAGKLSPPVGHPQSLPFLLSTAFVFLAHPVSLSLPKQFKFQRPACRSCQVRCCVLRQRWACSVCSAQLHTATALWPPEASPPSLWAPSAVPGCRGIEHK